MNVFTKLLCAAALLVTGGSATAQTLLDNFENTRLVDYPSAQGVLTPGVDNPASGGENTSSKVAKFVRSATDQYSTIALRPKAGGMFANVSAYRTGTQSLTLKFLSPGPGTQVQIVMQNAARTAYPKGNYAGDFFATTAAPADTWELLTFKFTAGEADKTFDPTITATDIDQLAVLIAPGSVNNGATYYFDDLMGPAVVAAPVTGTPPVVLDNFDGTRLMDYPAVQGTLEVVANPFSGGENTSAQVAKFVRSATDQYATIAAKLKTGKFTDVSAYRTGGRRLTMKFLSPGPGTQVQLVMQVADLVKYPLGNYAGDFFATTAAPANTWETLTFNFVAGTAGGSFDPAVKATDIDQIAILIAPGSTNNGATYYFDDLLGPVPASVTATRAAQTATAAFGTAYPNPTAGTALLPYSLKEAAVVSLAVYDGLGRRVAQVLDQQRQPAGEFSAKLNTAGLAPGLYTCRLLVNGAALTRQLLVQ